MGEYPIYRGWDVLGRAGRRIKRTFANKIKSGEAREVTGLAASVRRKLAEYDLDTDAGRRGLARAMAEDVLAQLGADPDTVEELPFYDHLKAVITDVFAYEGLFDIHDLREGGSTPDRSELWAVEDNIRRTEKVLDGLDEAMGNLVDMFTVMVSSLVERHPDLLQPVSGIDETLSFKTTMAENLTDLPEIVEAMVHLPFVPELEEYATTTKLKDRLEYNLIVASDGVPGDPSFQRKTLKLPTKMGTMPASRLIKTYLSGTPLAALFDASVSLPLPQATRFEHQHIVAGSGHGKTQTLQHLILHDLEAVADDKASIVVIDSQSDLINTIAGMSVFAPGGRLTDRLVLIDPTDVEWPVALNLFDVGMERINQYSQLDRERLVNGILELYDFVLGSLLEAGMTQKQSIIFRYLTRLLLHIPNATIHTFRELLEDGGYLKYQPYIEKLSGSAKAFFETEYQSREFTGTRKQVLRRLYGILENQTFERMFSHPKSKLDLFSEMNAGKVILINTAKDLLKENGTEIFGRFFIAMIAQAAQERAVLPKNRRLPTFVYIDEANDYFDRNIGIILSQARKYNIGMVLAHQFLGQLDTKLQEAIFANTSIKFAGGVSAKDARALAAELRTDASFIEGQDKLSFAAFVKGSTKHAVSIAITPGEMEGRPRLTKEEKDAQQQVMRENYAVHYTEINKRHSSEVPGDADHEESDEKPDKDDGEPMAWE